MNGIITSNLPFGSANLNTVEPAEGHGIVVYQFTSAIKATSDEAKATLRKVLDNLARGYVVGCA